MPPTISIGMPVFNGAATVGHAIEALLAQTFGDFELIVCDNASTDATGAIVSSLAERDKRIRYIRHRVNLGANLNYSHAAKVARGDYLKWASASDWCAPTFLERCHSALEHEPAAVLARPRTRLFQHDLSSFTEYPDDFEILDQSPLARLLRLEARMRLNNAINGLIRMSALRRTRLIESYYCADMVLMGHLALLGKYVLVDEPLFYRRMEPETATALQDAAGKRRHHFPEVTSRTLLQGWKLHLGWFRAAASAPMPIGERLGVMKYLARKCIWDRETLIDDIRGVWRYATRTTG
jgi:glycosyltransferase involved in cell wall biosynthesis